MQNHDYKINCRTLSGKIELFDKIRGIWVVATPEERVRQLFIRHLICNVGYPASHIAVEHGFKFANGKSQRCDIVVFDSKLKPFMVVECKAQSVKISPQTAQQATRYNANIGASYITLTNIERTLCFAHNSEGGYSNLASLPKWE